MKRNLLQSYSIICVLFFSSLSSLLFDHSHIEENSLALKDDGSFNSTTHNPEYPFLQHFRGRNPIYGLGYNNQTYDIYYSLSNHGVGRYNTQNNETIITSLTTDANPATDENIIYDFIYEQSEDRIYAGTEAGLYIIDINSWNYQHFNTSHGLVQNRVRHLDYDIFNHRLFVGTDEGLNIFYTENLTFSENILFANDWLHRGVSVIAYDSDEDVIYSTKDAFHLFMYNFSDGSETEVYITFPEAISEIVIDKENERLLIGVTGVICLNLTTYEVIADYPYSTNVKELCYYPKLGGLVFTTNYYTGCKVTNMTSGLSWVLNRTHGLYTEEVFSIIYMTDNSTGVPIDKIIFGGKGGFSIFSIDQSTIDKVLKVEEAIATSRLWQLSYNDITKDLYLGGQNYLTALAIDSFQISKIYDYIDGLPLVNIYSVQYYNKLNSLFIATSVGIYQYNLTGKNIESVYTENNGLASNLVYQLLLVEEQKNLYIGTSSGLDVLDLTTLNITHSLLTGQSIESFTINKAKTRLYVGTEKTIHILNLKAMTEIDSLYIGYGILDLELYESKAILFAGTYHGGLFLINVEPFEICTQYTTATAPLTDSIVDAITFDEETETLFLSNFGIIVFDYQHDFWFNLNDAELEDLYLYHQEYEDMMYIEDQLFFCSSLYGLFVINHEDNDQDGVFDCYETWLFKTNTTTNDTDSDGYLDGEELWQGFDPLDPNSHPYDYQKLWFLFILLIPIIGTLIACIKYRSKN